MVGQAARFDGRLGLRARAGWVAPAGGCRPGWVASAKFEGRLRACAGDRDGLWGRRSRIAGVQPQLVSGSRRRARSPSGPRARSGAGGQDADPQAGLLAARTGAQPAR